MHETCEDVRAREGLQQRQEAERSQNALISRVERDWHGLTESVCPETCLCTRLSLQLPMLDCQLGLRHLETLHTTPCASISSKLSIVAEHSPDEKAHTHTPTHTPNMSWRCVF